MLNPAIDHYLAVRRATDFQLKVQEGLLRPLKMLSHLPELDEQSLQRRPTFEINDFPAVFVERRTVVLAIVDIQAGVNYSDFLDAS